MIGMEINVSEEIKTRIDSMSRIEIARILRFEPSSSEIVRGDNYIYLLERFNELGGMKPEISKTIAW